MQLQNISSNKTPRTRVIVCLNKYQGTVVISASFMIQLAHLGAQGNFQCKINFNPLWPIRDRNLRSEGIKLDGTLLIYHEEEKLRLALER